MRKLFILILLCLAQRATGQMERVDGLRSNSIVSLLADSRGYLWIGTAQGLNRYDGYEVKTRFPESGDAALREVFSSPVTSIEEDAAGRLWMECESGTYYVYDTHTTRFLPSANAHLLSLGIRCKGKVKVKVGRKGTLWVLSADGIFRYDFHARELKSWNCKPPMPGTGANLIAEMSDGIYISANHHVWHFVTSTGELQQERLPQDMQQSLGEHSLLADGDGTLWVYSTREEHICRYIVGGRCVREMATLPQTTGASQNNAIRDILDDGRGNVWIATDHKGLFVYNKKTGTVNTASAYGNITCLTADWGGTIWMGHLKTGISFTSEANSIMQPHARPCGDILALAYDTDGNLWMGTDGDGIYRETTDGTIEKTTLPNITVMALLSDGKGGMWAGTYNQGLYHLTDGQRWKRYDSFPCAEAWTLASDDSGNIWASSSIGKTVIFNTQDETARVVTTPDGSDIHGNSLRYDGRETMYIASVYGLWSYNLKNGQCTVAFGNRKGTGKWMSQMIGDVMTDPQQNLMVMTHPEGVTVFDRKRDTLLYVPRSGDAVKGMTRDHDGTYWLCTSSGSVAGIRPMRQPDGRLILHSSLFTLNSSLFTLHSSFSTPGIGTPQFYFNNDAMTCSPQGEILMGGTEGYMRINPRQLMALRHEEGQLTISEIAVGERLKASEPGSGIRLLNEQTDTVLLNHDAAYLTVKFFAGSVDGIQRRRYAYRLLGQMSDWVTTDHNYVSFHSLPPGDYILQLSLCLDDGTLSPPRQLHISVMPPFYRTTIMYIVYALILISIAFFLWRRMRRRQQERTEHQRQQMERLKREQITEMKLQFFTNISHDLRTPLTLIISPLEHMVKQMEAGKTPDNLLSQLRNIRKNAQLLLGEVGALLDFRRLDAGGETLNPKSGDIVDHLNSILISFGDYAEERGIRLRFEHDADSFIMSYDREKISKVMYNLFSNALKFTPSGGTITLSFQQQQDNIVIAVADTGKGIPDSDKPNIFRRFYQSATNDCSQTGSGIGLHIASDYVRLHHGTIDVSDNKPVGTVFTVILPVKSEELPTGVPSAEDMAAANSSLFTLNSSLPRLLIVDDNPDMLSFISSCMKENYEVFTATDGAAALELLQKKQTDLIISDVMMPGIDGFELCRRLKSDINLSHIPIILLTARDTDVSRIEGLQLGADDYLTKPFNIEVLRLRVKKFMEREQTNHRQFRQKMNIEPSEITITPLDEQFIKRAIALVEQNISDSDFSVETLAAEVAMSRSTLYKKLMAITGLGPSEFVRTIRIKRGRALLETSQMQITEIAYAVGFTTTKSFTMNFKAEYGMTPSEFRQSLGQPHHDIHTENDNT